MAARDAVIVGRVEGVEGAHRERVHGVGLELREVDAVARDLDVGELGEEPEEVEEAVLVDGEVVAGTVVDPVCEEDRDRTAIAERHRVDRIAGRSAEDRRFEAGARERTSGDGDVLGAAHEIVDRGRPGPHGRDGVTRVGVGPGQRRGARKQDGEEGEQGVGPAAPRGEAACEHRFDSSGRRIRTSGPETRSFEDGLRQAVGTLRARNEIGRARAAGGDSGRESRGSGHHPIRATPSAPESRSAAEGSVFWLPDHPKLHAFPTPGFRHRLPASRIDASVSWPLSSLSRSCPWKWGQ